MMRRVTRKASAAGCALGAMLWAGGALASPVQDTMGAFGLLGVWADSCAGPAAGNNEYATYSASPDGTVKLVYSNAPGEPGNTYRWEDAEILGPHFMWVKGVFLGDGLEQYSIVERQGDRLRVWSNIDSSGRVLVERGAFPGGGAPAWSEKCGG